jgi:hypothetical protein
MNCPDYGDERLTKDGRGYIYWRGVNVEHCSHDSVEAELESARGLIKRCEHLESLGILVTTGSAVWSWEWFANLTPYQFGGLSPLAKEILAKHPALYEDAAGRFCWLIERQKDPPEYPYTVVGEFEVFDHGEQSRMALTSNSMGGLYHSLKDAGWNLAEMGQGSGNGCCYATTEQVLNWLRNKGAM